MKTFFDGSWTFSWTFLLFSISPKTEIEVERRVIDLVGQKLKYARTFFVQSLDVFYFLKMELYPILYIYCLEYTLLDFFSLSLRKSFYILTLDITPKKSSVQRGIKKCPNLHTLHLSLTTHTQSPISLCLKTSKPTSKKSPCIFFPTKSILYLPPPLQSLF